MRVASGQAGALFGGQLPLDANRDLHLSGVLTLGQRKAAAIIRVKNEPPYVVPVGSAITGAVKLYEVRARSVIVDRDSVRSELFLPLNSGGPMSYVR
ncbi:type II secretion system protein N [Paraburkholderia polaris]|uniref:type II secretion system protein N n=1 Tax=Paraburkholderia polaris TaxID=2728848 RepID=UPI002E31DD8A|nr:type II secretion system protein N [Paraburkholderia polaris]